MPAGGGDDAKNPTVGRLHVVALPGRQSDRTTTETAGASLRREDPRRRLDDATAGVIEIVEVWS
jgi:hypothetical protein